MKSINLTKAIRTEIVDRLVSDSTKAEVEKLKSIHKTINTEYWKEWDAEWLKLSGVNTEQLSNMLSAEIIGKVTEGYVQLKVKEDLQHLQSEVPASIPVDIRFNRIYLKMRSDSVHPGFNWRTFECTSKLQERAESLTNQIMEMAKQARQLRDDLNVVLGSCRTSKQLAEVLPEAVKYLPSTAKKNELVSSKLISDVQARLRTGVPT